ncbi:10692_t:CDS:2, partial [Scutellospora calospora]
SLPPKPNLKYTQCPGQYPIPNKYQIEAFWGRNKKNHVQTSIDYVEGIPYFKIEWIHNEQNYIIVSQISPSDASNKYLQIMDQSNISRRGYRALTTALQDLPKE